MKPLTLENGGSVSNHHLLKAFLWTLLALFLGCLALVAEGEPKAPKRSQELHRGSGGSGGYSKAFRTP